MIIMDLFERYEQLPQQVIVIMEKFCDQENDYYTCKRLVIDLEKVGYSCEYGLDAEPYDLRKID